jgi:tetratricopeptide (TPR) repeat protein
MGYAGLNRFDEARTVLQQAAAAKTDNHFIHQQLYDVAALTGDDNGLQAQMKWAEGKPTEYLLLNEAAFLAASHGQMHKGDELTGRSLQSTNRLGFKETTADTEAWWAFAQAEMGNAAKARELSASSAALAHGRSNMVPAALALSMVGDAARSQSILDDLSRRFPDDTLLHNVTIPEAKALAALNRKKPEEAIAALQSATPYELGSAMGLTPIYIRGLAYLLAQRGPEAAAEFQKIIDHRGISPVAPEHSLAKLGLGRAYQLIGDKGKAKAAYQDFFALWKDADNDLPILKEAKTEYATLE